MKKFLSDGTFTRSPLEDRTESGQFAPLRNVGLYETKAHRPRKICACCRNTLPVHKRYNSVFCDNCGEFIRKLKWRNSSERKRLRDELKEWRKFGTLGRVLQQLRAATAAKKKAKNLNERLKYFRNKEKDTNEAREEGQEAGSDRGGDEAQG
jgi:predicted RNA-binding Zn-ribbon protein involved in translation (DUF1610 family)